MSIEFPDLQPGVIIRVSLYDEEKTNMIAVVVEAETDDNWAEAVVLVKKSDDHKCRDVIHMAKYDRFKILKRPRDEVLVEFAKWSLTK